MKIEANTVVTLDYTLTDVEEGEEIESTDGVEPFQFIYGVNDIIPGLEKALEGRSPGEAFRVVLEPKDGYGEYDDSLIGTFPRSQFPDPEDLEVGMEFQIGDDDGDEAQGIIIAIEDDKVTVDANHELAGVALAFEIQIREVRRATPDEVKHQHVHGPGGHHH